MQKIHPRVSHGFNAQNIASDHLLHCFPHFNILSVALPGSNLPDIVASYNNVTIQFEVKSCNTTKSPIVVINNTVKRTSSTLVDKLIPLFSNNRHFNVAEVVDFSRATDSTVGFPCDQGAPRSGKLPISLELTHLDPVCKCVHAVIVSYLQQKGNNYFALVTKRPKVLTNLFHVGSCDNILGAPPLPPIHKVRLRTYGTAPMDSMRAAVKVTFQQECGLVLS